MDFEYEDGETWRLNEEGMVDVAHWVVTAWESGHFDWDLICGGSGDDQLAERWRLVHWLNEEKMLDEIAELYEGSDESYEIGAAILLTFFMHSVSVHSQEMGMRPTDFIEMTFILGEAESEITSGA